MQLLLGGLITLAVTAFVQILIIPWVQQRNRRRERWEKDMIELEGLLHEELPQALSKASVLTRIDPSQLWKTPDLSELPPEGRKVRREAWRAWRLQKVTAESDLQPAVNRMWRLERRIRLLNRDAPVWRVLLYEMGNFTFDEQRALGLLPDEDGKSPEDLWDAARKSLAQLTDTFEAISEPMRPPPRGPLSGWAYANAMMRQRRRTEKLLASKYHRSWLGWLDDEANVGQVAENRIRRTGPHPPKGPQPGGRCG